MEIQKNLAFTREEYLGRVDRVRAGMKERGLDALLLHTPENICYLSGFQTSGYYFAQVLIVPADRDPVFVVRALEKQNVDAWSWLADDQAIGYMDYDNPSRHRVRGDLGSQPRQGLSRIRDGRLLVPSYLTLRGAEEAARRREADQRVGHRRKRARHQVAGGTRLHPSGLPHHRARHGSGARQPPRWRDRE